MRIISGKHRSRVIKMVDVDTTRETTDKVRGAIFNLLSFSVIADDKSTLLSKIITFLFFTKPY